MTSHRANLLAWHLPLLAAALLMLSGQPGRAADEPDPEPLGHWPRTRPSDRPHSARKLKQIALAFHNFNDAYRGMPAAAIRNKAGKPLLSWRVAILPFIEQVNLYREFRLDEPWDSKHNKKLLAKMPALYAPTIQGKPARAGTTYYQVFTGPNTPFNPKNVRGNPPINLGPSMPASFPDGTSNTFLVVEGGEAVPWTKPVDLVHDARKAPPKLGGLFREGFHAALADGSVRFIGRKIDRANLRRLIDPADGEVINWQVIPVARAPAGK